MCVRDNYALNPSSGRYFLFFIPNAFKYSWKTLWHGVHVHGWFALHTVIRHLQYHEPFVILKRYIAGILWSQCWLPAKMNNVFVSCYWISRPWLYECAPFKSYGLQIIHALGDEYFFVSSFCFTHLIGCCCRRYKVHCATHTHICECTRIFTSLTKILQ